MHIDGFISYLSSRFSLSTEAWISCIIGAIITFAIGYAIYLIQKKESMQHKHDHDARLDEIKHLHEQDSEKIQVLYDLILRTQKVDINETESAILESRIEVAAAQITEQDSDKAQALKAIAERDRDKAEELLDRIAEREHDLLEVYDLNAMNEYRHGDYQAALSWFERMRVIQPENYDIIISVLTCMDELGRTEETIALTNHILLSLGREDERYSRKVLELYRFLLNVYYRKQDYDQMEHYLNQMKELTVELYGEDAQEMAGIYNNLAILAAERQQYEESVDYYKKAIALCHSGSEDDDISNADTYSNLSITYTDMGQYQDAIKALNTSLQIKSRYLEPEHPGFLSTLNNLATVYTQLEEYDKAEKEYLRCREIITHRLGVQHPSYIINQNNLAVLYGIQQKYDQAEEVLRQIVEAEQQEGVENQEVALHVLNLSTTLLRQEKYEQAMPYVLRANELYMQLVPPEHPKALMAKTNLGFVYDFSGDNAQAQKLFGEVVESYHQLGLDNTLQMAMSKGNLAQSYINAQLWQQAAEVMKEALDIYAMQLPDSEHHNSIKQKYALILQQLNGEEEDGIRQSSLEPELS